MSRSFFALTHGRRVTVEEHRDVVRQVEEHARATDQSLELASRDLRLFARFMHAVNFLRARGEGPAAGRPAD